ncbi:MAG: hypothetical protein F6K00_19430 [Leptolyngbya sp. SIOISBB]|nr:hypothetical protein [Leptolyngbya sp. SIOISBB]
MSAAVMAKRVIDISGFWPAGEDGEPQSINSVVTDLMKTPLQMTRYTLEKAKSGDLTGADVDTIDKLLELCSRWTGKKVTYDDITTEKED